jgi:tRNA uridine 5-carboxymethylaminomethyl modification enzyme
MLGRSKGAAMWSPRAQCDKSLFSALWRRVIENTPGLSIWQDSVVDLFTSGASGASGVDGADGADGVGESRRVTGVRTALGVEFRARAVILTAGTFLSGLIHVGRAQVEGGRIGEGASKGLTDRLVELGVEAGRM